jgi:hypothetical protein
MAISKKGSRKIIVDNIEYLYKISKVKQKSEWREQEDELDDIFMRYANYYGLGKVKNISINIVIQLKEHPISSFFIKFNTILVDGFMGAEQITQIKPKFISQLIHKGLNDGWKPNKKGNYRLNLLEKNTKETKKVVFQLPNMDEYLHNSENIEALIKTELANK